MLFRNLAISMFMVSSCLAGEADSPESKSTPEQPTTEQQSVPQEPDVGAPKVSTVSIGDTLANILGERASERAIDWETKPAADDVPSVDPAVERLEAQSRWLGEGDIDATVELTEPIPYRGGWCTVSVLLRNATVGGVWVVTPADEDLLVSVGERFNTTRLPTTRRMRRFADGRVAYVSEELEAAARAAEYLAPGDEIRVELKRFLSSTCKPGRTIVGTVSTPWIPELTCRAACPSE